MADGDVGFLNALRIVGGHVQEQIDPAGQLAAGFAGKRNAKGASAGTGIHTTNDVWAVTAGRQCHQDVAWRHQGFDLTFEDAFKAEIVARGGEDRANSW